MRTNYRRLIERQETFELKLTYPFINLLTTEGTRLCVQAVPKCVTLFRIARLRKYSTGELPHMNRVLCDADIARTCR